MQSKGFNLNLLLKLSTLVLILSAIYLSNAEERRIDILNPHSYPVVGGKWSIRFHTTGSGELKIFDYSFPNVEFEKLYALVNGETVKVPVTIKNGEIVADWNYKEGIAVFRVNSEGKHLIEFSFGNTVFAENQAGYIAVQRGTKIGRGSQITDTISEVNPSKAFILFRANTNDPTPDDWQFTPNITDTTVTFTRYDGSNKFSRIRWQVVESSDISVQRGEEVLPKRVATVNVTINEVNLSETFVIVYGRCADEQRGDNHAGFFAAKLTNSTNLMLRRGNENKCEATVSWQVVEWNGAKVQSGESIIPDLMDNVTASIDPVDLTRTFLIFGTASIGRDAGMDSNLIQGKFLSPTKIMFTHEPGSTYASSERIIDWYVVEIPDASVQSGNMALRSDTVVSINEVNPSRSFHISSGWNTGGGQIYSNSLYTVELVDGTTLLFDKQTILQTQNIEWFVVEIPEVSKVIDVSVSNIPIEFGSLNPNTTDNQPLTGPVIVTVHQTTNVNWNLSVKATGDFVGNGIIPISNLEFGNTSENVVYDMRTVFQGPELFSDWRNQPAPVSDTDRMIYFEMSIPEGAQAGDYSTQIVINVSEVVN